MLEFEMRPVNRSRVILRRSQLKATVSQMARFSMINAGEFQPIDVRYGSVGQAAHSLFFDLVDKGQHALCSMIY